MSCKNLCISNLDRQIVGRITYYRGYRVGMRNALIDKLTEKQDFPARIMQLICGLRQNGGYSKHPQDCFTLDGGTIGWPHFARANFHKYLEKLCILTHGQELCDCIAYKFFEHFDEDPEKATDIQTEMYEGAFFSRVIELARALGVFSEIGVAIMLRVANSYGFGGMSTRARRFQGDYERLAAWYGAQRNNYPARITLLRSLFDESKIPDHCVLPYFCRP